MSAGWSIGGEGSWRGRGVASQLGDVSIFVIEMEGVRAMEAWGLCREGTYSGR